MILNLSLKVFIYPEGTSLNSRPVARLKRMSPPSRLVWVNVLSSDLQQVHCGIDSTERQVVIVQRKEHQTSRVTTAWGRRAGWKSFVVGRKERRRCDWFLESQRGLPPTTTCTLSWVKYGYLNVGLSRCSQNLQKPTKKLLLFKKPDQGCVQEILLISPAGKCDQVFIMTHRCFKLLLRL